MRNLRNTLLCLAASAAASASLASTPAEDLLRSRLPEIFAKAAAHYKALDAAATPLADKGGKGMMQVPHGYDRKSGRLDMRDVNWWTTGHYPGSLWYLYEATGDGFFRDRAMWWTNLLEPNKDDSSHHDTGFMMYCSYGNARRILKTDEFDGILLATAKSLSKRFNGKLGVIRSWGKISDTKHFLVIPDNMMNLELLEWAGKNGFKEADAIARSHATKTMANHFREDGGTYHVLDYSLKDGRVQGIERGQGASCFTAWSRGQAWAIYGYTMMYRETGDAAYLDFAQKVADFAIANENMPADGVPWWDFGAPGEERDSSAAAIMASGLLELQKYAPKDMAGIYRAFAVKQLLSLAGPEYFSEGDEAGHWLLKHGVGHKPAGTEIDTPLDYGDYYFLEALLRFRALGD
ncbi:MAG: glycoside hydrolase family 88 protein [Kiritimatiellae bacterium]|nr:glycoside hydrolase family 88 protein [Kiritimatiellia bacterium]